MISVIKTTSLAFSNPFKISGVYKLVGAAYVHGFMEAQAVDLEDQGLLTRVTLFSSSVVVSTREKV